MQASLPPAPSAAPPDRAAPRHVAAPELGIALGLLLLAAMIAWQIWSIPVSPVYATIGPTVFPTITAIGLLALAVALFVEALQGGWQTADEKAVALDRRALVFVVAGLAANVALIDVAGFTVASTALFVLVAHGFGSRNPLRDGAVGFALALVAYFGFAKALGVNIGAGYVERLLGG